PVPHLHPEVADFQAMPRVFATGFMVGLMEWACMQLMAPHLDAGEGSLGVHIDVNHTAATPPGFTVTVDVECTEVVGKKISFKVKAHDGVDQIGADAPGFHVTVEGECTEGVGKKISFKVKAHDGGDQIGAGRHERFVVAWDKFDANVADKARRVANSELRVESGV